MLTYLAYKYSVYAIYAIPNDEAVMLNLLGMGINTMTVITSTSPVYIVQKLYYIIYLLLGCNS